VKRAVRVAFIVWAVLVPARTSWGAADPQPHWNDVKASLRQGAYREALQPLDAILEATPNDPWAQLYRTLCTLRLQATRPFLQLSYPQLWSLKQQLQQEERGRSRWAVTQKAYERRLREEQARWDRELQLLQREAQREQVLRRQQAQRESLDAARAERARHRSLVREETVREAAARPPAPVTAAEPEEPMVASVQATPRGAASAPGEPTAGDVELAPVIVPTAAGVPPEESPTPSLVGRALPPAGAVQINANQMHVSPDRKIAIADGDVEIVFENAILTSDHVTLFTDTKDVYAEGRVRLEEGNQVFRGEMAHYNLDTKKGRFLQGTMSAPPWHEHGRSVEHIAEGVFQVTPGYLTSCDQEPPHFKFAGRRAIVFADDKLARIRNAAFVVEQLPFFYLPWMVVADRQSPFFIIPGKKKPWEQFALMGYRYEWPEGHKGALRLDWRRTFGWAVGVDHQFDTTRLGKGLLKVYYNEEGNRREPRSALPKGADVNRYRLLWRHVWQPLPDTTMVTDVQEFSDANFRKDLLFREEFTREDAPESFVSVVRNDPNYTLTGLVRKRMNRFQTVSEAFPQLTMDVRQQRIGETQFFSQSQLDFANLQTKRAHSETDTDVVRVDWFQKLSYALNLFRPILVTPNMGVRQTYYTKDIQGGSERPQGRRDVLSGQFSMGADASLKLFRIFPAVTNVLGLNLNGLRHVLTPTISHTYVHRPTVPNELLNFASASSVANRVSFGLENKLQTRRPDRKGKMGTVDIVRFLASLPYTFHGHGNKQGGRLGDWSFDLEMYPWNWLRLETDWSVRSILPTTVDNRLSTFNIDLVAVGGQGTPTAQAAPDIQAPVPKGFEAGPKGGLELMPQGQWYLGLGHRYSQNSKTESVVQYDWRFSEKWQLGSFHRFTWKEVAGASKRFRNMREYQYSLRRDLHDWVGELVYRVDREFGEELFLTFTLKAYPQLPIEFETGYHQPKIGSQSSPFSPIQGQSAS